MKTQFYYSSYQYSCGNFLDQKGQNNLFFYVNLLNLVDTFFGVRNILLKSFCLQYF